MEKLIRYSMFICSLFSACLVYGAGISDFQITFQTTDCNGNMGIASVNVEEIYRIQSMQCDPGSTLELKQVLVKSASGVTNYEVFTVTADEAKQIQDQIKFYMNSRRKALEKGSSIVVEE
jgi:hypothetical protein